MIVFAASKLWQSQNMVSRDSKYQINSCVINALYVEAMVLADEARSYFDNFGAQDRDHLTPMQRVSFSCESLKVTTRIMHVIAWLLTQRAIIAGEFDRQDSLSPTLRLGEAATTETSILDLLPADARALIESSTELYLRVKRLDKKTGIEAVSKNEVRTLLRKIERAF